MQSAPRTKKPSPRKLGEQERAFARAVVEGLTQTEAARRAGYSGNDVSLATTGSRLMRAPKLAREIARLRDILEAKAMLTRQARMAMLEEMILARDTMPRDRLKALELRAKMGGDFVERRQIENTGPAGGPVKVEIVMTRPELHEEAKTGIGIAGIAS